MTLFLILGSTLAVGVFIIGTFLAGLYLLCKMDEWGWLS